MNRFENATTCENNKPKAYQESQIKAQCATLAQSGVVPSSHEIPMVLGEIEGAFERLYDSTRVICVRLESVLRNESSRPIEECKERPYVTDLANRLNNVRRSIDGLRENLSDVAARLEL